MVTLAIIGVVAALTIPTVINNYQKQVTVTQLKKVYSELHQAVNLSQIDNGPVKSWDFSLAYGVSNSNLLFNRHFKPYLKIAQRCPNGNSNTKPCGGGSGQGAVNYLLANGSSISFINSTGIYLVSIDINADKGPNETGKDFFGFMLDPSSDGLYPYNFPSFSGVTRDKIIKGGGIFATCGCTKEAIWNSKHNCTALIMFDNWQIKDDYPW